MPRITFIDPNGVVHKLDARVGTTIMENAVKHNIPGIDADCGGACACATCHIYVEGGFIDKTGQASEMEQDMLDFAIDTKDNSRLSCQLEITEDYDGTCFRIPEQQ